MLYLISVAFSRLFLQWRHQRGKTSVATRGLWNRQDEAVKDARPPTMTTYSYLPEARRFKQSPWHQGRYMSCLRTLFKGFCAQLARLVIWNSELPTNRRWSSPGICCSVPHLQIHVHRSLPPSVAQNKTELPARNGIVSENCGIGFTKLKLFFTTWTSFWKSTSEDDDAATGAAAVTEEVTQTVQKIVGTSSDN